MSGAGASGQQGGEAGPGRVGGWVRGLQEPRLLSAPGRIASYRAAPALKVTFTVAPGCGLGFARGVPGRQP